MASRTADGGGAGSAEPRAGPTAIGVRLPLHAYPGAVHPSVHSHHRRRTHGRRPDWSIFMHALTPLRHSATLISLFSGIVRLITQSTSYSVAEVTDPRRLQCGHTFIHRIVRVLFIVHVRHACTAYKLIRGRREIANELKLPSGWFHRVVEGGTCVHRHSRVCTCQIAAGHTGRRRHVHRHSSRVCTH